MVEFSSCKRFKGLYKINLFRTRHQIQLNTFLNTHAKKCISVKLVYTIVVHFKKGQRATIFFIRKYT